MTGRLVLASASPRRVALLREAGVAFEQRPAHIDETRAPGERAEEYVVRLAEAKARAAWIEGTRSLGADTVVVLGERVLGKPASAAEARRMLEDLSGREHRVLTGTALFDGATCHSQWEQTVVRFRVLSEAEITSYLDTGEPFDKAGAYGIQGRAGRFVEAVHGSYSNVVGLPLEAVLPMLR